jgi:CcmD family protein
LPIIQSMKKTLIILFSILWTVDLSAQTESLDFMHSIGKIYVVIAVLVAIFLGIIGFLVYLERKLTKLESLIED